MTKYSELPVKIASVVAGYPDPAKQKFYQIRSTIFAVAQSIPAIGAITETLKWGEPAYLTEASKSGATIRIDWKQKNPEFIGIYLNCQTTMLESMRLNYPDAFTYQGNRAILVRLNPPIPEPALSFCIRMALTYHSSKK